jgi:protein TonB
VKNQSFCNYKNAWKVILGLGVIWHAALIPAFAKQSPSAQQLLDAAHKASDLTSLGPYVLHATVVVNPGNSDERRGRLTISRDHDRARVSLEFAGNTEERVISGDKVFVHPGPSMLFASGLSEFDQSWDPGRPQKFSLRGHPSYGKVRAEKSHERDAWCMDEKFETGKNWLCFDAVTSVLLRDGSSGKNRKEFLDYVPAGAQLYPQKVEFFRENLAPFEVDNISVTPMPLTEDVFKVPENSIEIEGCEARVSPKATSTPEPDFPKAARDSKRQATVVLYALVTEQGKITAVQALGTDQYGFSQNAEEKVRTWRFKPGTCNGRPVATEMKIEVDFRLY